VYDSEQMKEFLWNVNHKLYRNRDKKKLFKLHYRRRVEHAFQMYFFFFICTARKQTETNVVWKLVRVTNIIMLLITLWMLPGICANNKDDFDNAVLKWFQTNRQVQSWSRLISIVLYMRWDLFCWFFVFIISF